MRPLLVLTPVVACLLGLGSVGSTAGPNPSATSYTVTIENLQFSPAELKVHRGDRVIWVNKDFFPHTATAKDKTFAITPTAAISTQP